MNRMPAICGISEEEMLTQMSDDLNLLADKLKVTRDEIIGQLKGNYDRLSFHLAVADLYNPFSLLNAFCRW